MQLPEFWNPYSKTLWFELIRNGTWMKNHRREIVRPGSARIGRRGLTTTTTVDPGVPLVDCDGNPTQDGKALVATAARNTDNSAAIVVFNETAAPISYSAVLGTNAITTTIPGQAIQTLVWK
jgi:hypothetical protein